MCIPGVHHVFSALLLSKRPTKRRKRRCLIMLVEFLEVPDPLDNLDLGKFREHLKLLLHDLGRE